MTSIHTSVLLRRWLTSAAILASAMLSHPAAQAQSIVPTTPLQNPNGTLAGFATNEPSVYFLIPSRWAPLDGAHTPAARTTSTTLAGSTFYDLRLVLTPDYAATAPTVVALQNQDPHAVFFPLPMTIDHVTLFLPAALGSIQAELVPDEQGLSTAIALYYRLRFNAEQMGVLRVLAHSGLTMQGAVQYTYPSPPGVTQTAAPITIILDDADLAPSNAPPPDPIAWLADLLSTTTLSAPGVLDGPYALGAGINVQISNSQIDGAFVPGAWALQVGTDNTIRMVPTQTPDLTGTITFDLAQLGARIRVDYQATFAAALDLSFMQLTITQLDLTSVSVNGSPSAFFTPLLKKLIQTPQVQAKLSEAVTEELQRRILAEALFTLGVL